MKAVRIRKHSPLWKLVHLEVTLMDVRINLWELIGGSLALGIFLIALYFGMYAFALVLGIDPM